NDHRDGAVRIGGLRPRRVETAAYADHEGKHAKRRIPAAHLAKPPDIHHSCLNVSSSKRRASARRLPTGRHSGAMRKHRTTMCNCTSENLEIPGLVLRHHPGMTVALLPRKHRLLQIGDAGIAPRQHFAELVDQRRGRRVDEMTGVTKTDDASRALGNRDEVECLYPLDFVKCDSMHQGYLSRVG